MRFISAWVKNLWGVISKFLEFVERLIKRVGICLHLGRRLR